MPSGFQASEPSASFCGRDPEEDHRGHAQVGQLGHLLAQPLPRVLDDPGSEGMGGVADPSRTKRGDEVVDPRRVSATSRRSAGVVRKPAGSVLGERHGGDARTSRAPRFRPAWLARSATAAASDARLDRFE